MSSYGRFRYISGRLASTPIADLFGIGEEKAARDPSVPTLPLELAPSSNVGTFIGGVISAGGISPNGPPPGLKAEIGRVGPAIRALNRFRSRDLSDRPGVAIVPESSPSFVTAWAQSANVAIVSGQV